MKTLLVAFLGLSLFLGAGCAAGPFTSATGSSPDGTTPKYLTFRVKVNNSAKLDHSGKGYCIILFNANSEPIEVTSVGTFTDFIRYDGTNFVWYHRQGAVPTPGYSFVAAGTVNQFATVAPDDNSYDIKFNVNDSSILLNQYIVATRFTTHLVTTDNFNLAIIGRALDTLGQGPDIGNNTQYTLTVDKQTGVVTPYPSWYPSDPTNDWIIQPDLPEAYPYSSFDIENFQVISSN